MQHRQGHRVSDAALSFDDRASGSYAVQSDHMEDQLSSLPQDYRNSSVSQTAKQMPRTAEEVFHPSAFEQYKNPQMTRQPRYSPIPSEYNAPQKLRIDEYPTRQQEEIREYNEIIGLQNQQRQYTASTEVTRYHPIHSR